MILHDIMVTLSVDALLQRFWLKLLLIDFGSFSGIFKEQILIM